jgi:hypothetical protein
MDGFKYVFSKHKSLSPKLPFSALQRSTLVPCMYICMFHEEMQHHVIGTSLLPPKSTHKSTHVEGIAAVSRNGASQSSNSTPPNAPFPLENHPL